MATIGGALTAIKTALAQDATLAALLVPGDPPDALNLPALLVYADRGGFGMANMEGDWNGIYTLAVQVHVAKAGGLDRAHAALMDALPLVAAQLTEGYTASRFGGTVFLLGTAPDRGGDVPIRFAIEQDNWAGVPTLVLAFELDIRLAED